MYIFLPTIAYIQLCEGIIACGKVLTWFICIYTQDRDYLAGEHLTIADLLAITELQQPIAIGYDMIEDRPLLEAWMERVKSEIQPHFEKAHKLVFKWAAPYAEEDFVELVE